MADLRDLPLFVQKKDVKGFVAAYLECIQKGFRLSLPKQSNPDDLEDEWAIILQKVVNRYDESFLVKLSQFWKQLLQNNSENLTIERIGIILQKLGKAPEITPKKPLGLPPQIHSNSPPMDQGSRVSISGDYHALVLAMKYVASTMQSRNKYLQMALKERTPIPFIIAYLGAAYLETIPPVPRRTVLSVVRSEWEAILLEQYNYIPEEPFIKSLSSEWATLLTLKGIPTKLEHYKTLLYELCRKHPDKIPVQKIEERQALLRLFND